MRDTAGRTHNTLVYPEVQIGSDRATGMWHEDHQLTSLGRERGKKRLVPASVIFSFSFPGGMMWKYGKQLLK